MSKEPKTKEQKFKLNPAEFPIDEWKEKYGRVKIISVADSKGDKHDFIIVRPTQTIMDSLLKGVQDSKMHKTREIFRNSCVMAGDKEVFDKDIDVRNKVIEKIMDLFDNNLEVEEKEL